MIFSDEIKKDFPIFDRRFDSQELVYLDNAATTQKPRQVIDAVSDFYRNHNSNVHRGIHKLSEDATLLYDDSRKNIANFIGAREDRELVFVRNTTEALNLLSYTLGRSLRSGDEVLLSVMEHHSNIVPWQFLKDKGVVIRFVDIDENGYLDMNDFDGKLNEKTKIVSLTQISNVLGTINDVKKLGKMAHEKGAIFIVDGAQSAPHMKVNVKDIDCDFFAFSGHKMLGPSGIGGLYGKIELLEGLPPFMGGGEMIRQVTQEKSTWNEVPLKFEAGTPNIEGAIGLSAAVDYLRKLGMDNVREHEKEIIDYTLEREEEEDIPFLKSYGPRDVERRAGVYAFNLGEIPLMNLNEDLEKEGLAIGSESIHPHDVASGLDSYSVAVRSGHHCAMPLNLRLGVMATSRASFYIYNSKKDVDALFEGLKKVEVMYRHEAR